MTRPCHHSCHQPACAVCRAIADPGPIGLSRRDHWRSLGYEIAEPGHRSPAACRHLGRPTGRVLKCAKCPADRSAAPEHECAIHGACTVSKPALDTRCCAGCEQRESRPTRFAPDFYDLLPDGGTAEQHKEALKAVLAMKLAAPANLAGDAIITYGEGPYWVGMAMTVRLLRELGCNLPVHVWHRGPVPEIPGASMHDATRYPHRMLGGWEVKTHAILHTTIEHRYRRLVCLDADCHPVADPSSLLPLLDRAPVVFWNDQPRHGASVNWPAFGLTGPYSTIQGGQLLIDVQGFWREICIAHWLNQHSDYTYQYGYGDQDMWRVALRATGQKRVELSQAPWVHPAFICKHDGRDWFVHRCQGKFFPGRPPARNDALPLEWRCWELFEELLVPKGKDATEVFTAVYKSGVWSQSPGQTPSGVKAEEAAPYVRTIRAVLAMLDARSVIDLGCGDGTITRQIPGAVGVDCVLGAVRLDLDRDREQLPAGDVALIRDVLQHWPSALVLDWLAWARSSGKWRWLVLTNDVCQKRDVADCPLGGHRELHPHMRPLRDVPGLEMLCEIGHKAMCVLRCDAANPPQPHGKPTT